MATIIESAPGDLEGVTGNVPVGAENTTGALPEIGNDHDIRVVISSAGFEPCLPLAHVVRRSQVCVTVTAPDLQATKLVDQKEVDYTGDRIGAIHRRGAVL